nr:HAD-IC family P-type ATPase [Chloroflexota bacterium]
LIFVIALAVAVVPEALPVIATLTLSRGALTLAKEQVVVKRLSSLEDLGNVTLLCTDKTGTLTENKPTIQRLVSSDDHLF